MNEVINKQSLSETPDAIEGEFHEKEPKEGLLKRSASSENIPGIVQRAFEEKQQQKQVDNKK